MKHACYLVRGVLVRVEGTPTQTRWTTYFCMECGAKATFRRGNVNIPHFAHAPYDPKGFDCELRSAPADASVQGGSFFNRSSKWLELEGHAGAMRLKTFPAGLSEA